MDGLRQENPRDPDRDIGLLTLPDTPVPPLRSKSSASAPLSARTRSNTRGGGETASSPSSLGRGPSPRLPEWRCRIAECSDSRIAASAAAVAWAILDKTCSSEAFFFLRSSSLA